MARDHADALRGLRAIWIDAGRSDEYFLDLGADAFRAELAMIGVPDDQVRHELFDGAHGGLEWRYPEAIGRLTERLRAQEPPPRGPGRALGHEQRDVGGPQQRLPVAWPDRARRTPERR